MKAENIKVGKNYIAKVNNKLVTVRVHSIKKGRSGDLRYHVTNLSTGSKTIFCGTDKFHSEVLDGEGLEVAELCGKPTNPGTCKRLKGHTGICLETKKYAEEEDKKGSDPTTVNTASEVIRSDTHSKVARKSAGDSTTESETTSKEGKKSADPTISLRKRSKTLSVVERCTTPTQSDPTNGYPKSMKTLEDTPALSVVKDTGTAIALSSKKEASVPTSKGKGLADKLRSKLPSPTSIQSLNFSSVAGYKPTEEQEAILETAVQKGLKSLVIAAGAGTGKTSTLKMLEAVLPGRGQYTAFNRALVEESKTKFVRASCKTTHGLAFGEVGRRFAHRLKSSRIRSSQIAYTLGIHQLPLQVAGQDHPKVLAEGFLAGQVMMAVRRFCQSADREISGKHFRYIDGIDFPDNGKRTYANNEVVREYLLPFAVRVWEDQCSVQGSLPYNPDCYVKMWQLGEGSNRPYIGADYILLDEAQDTAPVMLDILRQQTHALVILVGDDCQQIYEWRGACNAMKAYPDAPRRLLSQSFRFGQAIADVANSILSNLNEKTDLIMKGLSSIPSRVTSVADPRCYLFRTNAGAVSRLLRGIEEGKKPFLIGGGKEVVDFVKGAKLLQNGQPTSHPELCCFSSWKEVCSYVEEDEGEDLRLMVKLVNEFKCKPILNALENMPDEESADEVISTAHKCVHPDTLVETPIGLSAIYEIGDEGEIGTPNGPSHYRDKFSRTIGKVLTITTEHGYEITVTPEHGITVYREGVHYKEEASKLKKGDWLRLRLSPVYDPSLPSLPRIPTVDSRAERYHIPKVMSAELGELLGMLVADGTFYKNSKGFRLVKRYSSVVDRFESLLEGLFGCPVLRGYSDGTPKAEVNSALISMWLLSFGGLHPNRKDIPWLILKSPLYIQAAFLKGLFEDGTVNVKGDKVDHIHFDNIVHDMVRTVQIMLLRFGIISARRRRKGSKGFDISTLYIYSESAKKFANQIGFVAEEKNQRLNLDFGENTSDLIPLTKKEIEDISQYLTVFERQNGRYRGYISRAVAKKVLERIHPYAGVVVERMGWVYSRVKTISEGRSETYCVTVPDGERFLQNGFDGWNSKGREWESVKLGADFPASNRMSDPDVRLLYVAATRAQHRLDIQDCPAFLPVYDKDPDREHPGISIRYTIDMPTEEELATFQAQQREEKPIKTGETEATTTEAAEVPQETTKERAIEETPSNGSSLPQDETPRGDFTFTNFQGKWRVRGPHDAAEKTVTVRLKSGATKLVTLKTLVVRFCDASIYEV